MGHPHGVETLYRVIAALLVLIAGRRRQPPRDDPATRPADRSAGRRRARGRPGDRVVAALIGVAGGELLIPTIVLLYAVDVKLAGSLSLAVSLPTMLVAFARYSRDDSFVVLRQHRRFVIAMAAGSIAGTIVGGLMLGVVPPGVLVPLLVALLLASAVKVWRHDKRSPAYAQSE